MNIEGWADWPWTGAASYLELQGATVRATEAERGLIEVRYDFLKELARLKETVGGPVDLPR